MTRNEFLERNWVNCCFRDKSLTYTLLAYEVTFSHIVVGFGQILSVGHCPSGVRLKFKTGSVTLGMFDLVDVY